MTAVLAAEVAAERRRLVRTLEAVGPTAPTSAGSWTAHDLASHLAAQDRARGVPAWAARRLVGWSGLRLSATYLDRPRVAMLVNGPRKPWAKALRILSQPPPAAVVRDPVAVVTLWEHVVHHEDVRRPNGVDRDDEPTRLDAVVAWIATYNRRRIDRRVRIVSEDFVGDVGAGPPMTVEGPLLDVVLWLSGRRVDSLRSDAPDDELERLRARLRG